MSDHLNHLNHLNHLKHLAPRYSSEKDIAQVKAIYNAPEPMHGYSMPQLRQVVRDITQTQLAGKSAAQVWDFWEKLWKRGRSFDEKMLAAAFWSERKNFELALAHHEPLMAWAHDLTNWAHSDALSSVYVRFLETLGKPVDEKLAAWNASENPWLRRQSVVSLLYYTRQRKKTPAIGRVFGAVQPLLGDEHYYVQKGVGWTIREAYQVDDKRTLAFIEKHLHVIQPAAYSAAVEKLSPEQKQRLREKRAAARR